jgi:hypothetical protein
MHLNINRGFETLQILDEDEITPKKRERKLSQVEIPKSFFNVRKKRARVGMGQESEFFV